MTVKECRTASVYQGRAAGKSKQSRAAQRASETREGILSRDDGCNASLRETKWIESERSDAYIEC